MPLTMPNSKKEVSDRMKSDYLNEVPDSNPFLRNSFLSSLIGAIAGVVYSFYIQLRDFLLVNIFPQTAEQAYLEFWGSLKGITRNAATQSTGFITVQGTTTTAVPLGTQFQTTDSITLETQAAATILTDTISITNLVQSGGTATATTASDHNFATGITVTVSGANEAGYNLAATITVTAANKFTYTVAAGTASPATGTIIGTFTTASIEVQSVEFGQDANVDAGSQVTITTPIAGVNDTAFVQFDGITAGTDEESDSDLRTRILDRWKNPVALFNVAAIETKAKEISGVTRVWVEEVTPAIGQVTTYFTRDNDATIIPSASEITDVKDNILTIKPANTADADVIVSAPTPVTVNFVFSALSPSTTTMQAAITASLTQLFLDETEVGSDLLEAQYLGAIINTIDTETGQSVTSFTLSSPTGDVSITSGEIAVLGTITY